MLLSTTLKASSKRIKKEFNAQQGAYELLMKLTPKKGEVLTLTLSNSRGEQTIMTYDEAKGTFLMDRTHSGKTEFSEFFPVSTKAPVHGGQMTELRLFVDKSSIEAFVNGGRTVMTNIVFPSEPYNTMTVKGTKGSKIQQLIIYNLTK